MLIFKYVSPDAAKKVFERDSELSIRFGLPKTYNDPYELFLEPDPPLEDEEERAFYNYFLGKVAEVPVACFSRRPDSVVMWAHYGKEGAGICLGFDEDALVNQFSLAYVGNIKYSDEPATVPSSFVKYAFTTGKNRHTLWLLATGRRAAYFMKRSDWKYEAERRIVVLPSAVEDRGNGILVGRVNPSALRYIIVGPQSDRRIRVLCQERGRAWGIPVLELRIGFRTFAPFFRGQDMPAGTWSRTKFQEVAAICPECREPTNLLESGKCQWCDISEAAKESAPRRSLTAIALETGALEGIPLEFKGMAPRGSLARQIKNKFRRFKRMRFRKK